ncbi:MAG: GerMN domain-containing protein [Mycobacteriales bacterium]
MRRPARVCRAPVLLLAGLLLAGCGVPQDGAPRALDPAKAPAGALPSPSTAPEPEPVGDNRAALYFVRDGQVVPITRPVPRSTSIAPLLELLFAGPTAAEREAGASSLIPSSLSVQKVERQGQTAVVTLEDTEDQVRPQALAFAQIVATLTPDRASGVRFRLDGADLAVPRSDGALTDAPVSRLDYADLLAPAPGPPPPAPG